MPSLRDTLLESFIANMVGLLVGTVLGGGAMFFVQRHINAGDAARKEVVLEAIPKLEKFRRAVALLEWDTMMDLEARDRAERFRSMVTATEARGDSLDEASDLIELKLRLSFDSATAADFETLVVELGHFRERAAISGLGLDKKLLQREAFADTSTLDEYAGLQESSDSLRMKIANFENRLLKGIN